MARMATLEQAVQAISGLTHHELYTGLKKGKYPGCRMGGARGKWVVDLDLIEARLKELMEQNMKQQIESEPIIEYGKLRKING